MVTDIILIYNSVTSIRVKNGTVRYYIGITRLCTCTVQCTNKTQVKFIDKLYNESTLLMYRQQATDCAQTCMVQWI